MYYKHYKGIDLGYVNKNKCVVRGTASNVVYAFWSQGSAPRSLVWSVRDLPGVLPPGGSGLASDGCHGRTLSPHVPTQSWSIEEALAVTTSADKIEVEVLPHMAKSSVGVLIDNSAVWTKGQLPALSINDK